MRRSLFTALIVILLDQLSKWAVVETLFKPKLGLPVYNFFEWYQFPQRTPFVSVDVLPFFNFTMMWNEGIGLGMLGGAGPIALIVLSLVIVAVLLYWIHKENDPYLHVTLGLMIGGAIGNVIDRSRYHAVVDFLDVHVKGWHYPTFNVADSCICIGVFLLLIQPLFKGKLKSA